MGERSETHSVEVGVIGKARAVLTLALASLLVGCAHREAPTVTVAVGDIEFRVEVAQGEQAQRDGLSGRESLPEGTGMLFAFEGKQEQQVWMAGMEIPIDVAWIADDRVLAVDSYTPCTLTDQSQCPRWTSPAPIDAFLEVPAGSLEGIEPGTLVTITEK
ncbi:MAG: DUF192 domain-containing protein [Dermabacter sp.]|nr:DUF192 domain-containing protein [Dermabacter sp.]